MTLCLLTAQAFASIYTVTGTSDPVATPICTGTSCPTLRAAVNAANADPGSTIQLGSSNYMLSQGALTLSVTMTIVGNGPSATKITQTGSDRVIFINAIGATVGLTGLTITGGDVVGAAPTSKGGPGGDAYGGGICNYGSLTLNNVLVTGNTAAGHFGGTSLTGSGGGGGGGGAYGGGIASGDPTSDPAR